MFSLPDNVVTKYPSGRWGFVGRVSTPLCWVMEDGSEVPPEIVNELVRSNYPAMVMKHRGVKTRAWESREAAVAFAESLGLTVTKGVD